MAHLTCYRSLNHKIAEAHRIKLQGLDPNKLYYSEQLGVMAHGSSLMNVGFTVNFGNRDFDSKTYTFEEK